MRCLIFDTETSGLDVTQDRICEIALIMYDLQVKKELLSFEKKINPGVHLGPKVVAVHGITDADVAKCPGFGSIAGTLAQLFGKVDLVVGHNIKNYDLPLISHEFTRHKVPVPRFPPVFDTMLEGRCCTEDGRIPNLGDLCWALDVEYDPDQAHSALYDVRVGLHAFVRGLELGCFQLPEGLMVKEAA